eukprot:2982903-Amphidinium_carterae.1
MACPDGYSANPNARSTVCKELLAQHNEQDSATNASMRCEHMLVNELEYSQKAPPVRQGNATWQTTWTLAASRRMHAI